MLRAVTFYCRALGMRGLLCTVRAKLARSSAFFTVVRKDCAFPFQLRVPTSDVPTYIQVFVHKEYEFRAERPPKVIVDAGANIGLASIFFANRYPDARIIAIEPEQSNFDLLKENVAPYANVLPIQAALWHRNEEINLVDPGLGKWGFMTEMKNSKEPITSKVCHTVRAITVDRLMNEHRLDAIDILKIDIEGAEREVFSDTAAWITNVDSLIVELHEHMKVGCVQSFYAGSRGFDCEWKQGENVYLSRGTFITRHTAETLCSQSLLG